MKTIPLTRGYVAVVDDEDYGRVSAFKWHAQVYAGGKNVYATSRDKIMHRFLLGVTDRKIKIDHRDGNGLNNQRENIRICDGPQNSFNRRKLKLGHSKYKGVTRHSNSPSWVARIRFGGKLTNLGNFATEEDAARAYNVAALRCFGEFAALNPVDGLPREPKREYAGYNETRRQRESARREIRA